jgi:hypothetical protein
MTTTYRVVDIVVPNRSSNKVKVTVAISPTDPAMLEGIEMEDNKLLKILSYGLTQDICTRVERVRTQEKLNLQIDEFQDVLVRAIITVQEPSKRTRARAAFQITDTRNGTVAGGVTIICSSPQFPTDLPSAAGPTNPCPLFIAAELTCVDPGADPRLTVGQPGIIDTTKPQDLVVLIENGGPKELTNALVCLEHTSDSNVLAVPLAWHIGTIEPGGRFWATWEVDARTALPGNYEATFVAQCDDYEPVRLSAKFAIRPPNW